MKEKVLARVKWNEIKDKVCHARYEQYRQGTWVLEVMGDNYVHFPDCAYFKINEIEILKEIK